MKFEAEIRSMAKELARRATQEDVHLTTLERMYQERVIALGWVLGLTKLDTLVLSDEMEGVQKALY